MKIDERICFRDRKHDFHSTQKCAMIVQNVLFESTHAENVQCG